MDGLEFIAFSGWKLFEYPKPHGFGNKFHMETKECIRCSGYGVRSTESGVRSIGFGVSVFGVRCAERPPKPDTRYGHTSPIVLNTYFVKVPISRVNRHLSASLTSETGYACPPNCSLERGGN